MLKKIIDNSNPEPSEYQVAIIVTPNKTVAACYCTLNQFGEYDNDFPYTGRLLYRDANNDHWIDLDGEVLPFDIETLEVKE